MCKQNPDDSILSKEIPRNKLLLLDQLGKGEFGRYNIQSNITSYKLHSGFSWGKIDTNFTN